MKTETHSENAVTNLTVADQALEKADAAELHALYRQKVVECDNVGAALEAIVKHYVGSSETPRYMPSDNAVGAMERVALAAIELAKAVAVNGVKK